MKDILPLGLIALLLVGCRPSDDAPATSTTNSTTDSALPTTDSAEPTVTTSTPTQPSSPLLDDLSVGSATLHPAFRPDLHYYWVRHSELDSDALVSAVPADPDDTVEVRMETPDGVLVSAGPEVPTEPDLRAHVQVRGPGGELRASYSVALLADDFPVGEVEGTTSGWTFITSAHKDSLHTDSLAVVDANGTPGWWRRLFRSGTDLRLTPDGRYMWIGRTEDQPTTRQNLIAGDAGTFDLALGIGDVPAHWELTEVDEHEFEVTPEGHIIRMLNYRVHEDLSPWGGPSDQRVMHMAAQELDADHNVIFEFTTEGIIPYDELPPNLSNKMDELDWEPIHFNSISVDPNDGHWVVSMQRVSVIAKFARTGPQAGEMLWQLGGEGSDFEFVDDVRFDGWEGIGGQHSARVTGPDRIEVFDNANGDAEERGDVRVVEFQLDHDAGTATKVYEHVFEGRGRAFAGGSVESLANGHHVVGFGSLTVDAQDERVPTVVELDASGNEVWTFTLPENSWTYRAWRFEGDPLTGTWDLP